MPETTLHTDEELLRLTADSHEWAFTKLFEKYRHRIYVYLLRHTKSKEVAEEIVTDIFMKLWSGRPLATHIENLPAFLHKVAFNKAVDFIRITARHEKLWQVYVHRAKLDLPQTPDTIVIGAETKAILLEAVVQLPPKRQLIYRMSREEGLTHEQIAEVLHLSKATVNNAIVASQQSIAKYMSDKGLGKAALGVFFLLG